MHRCGCINNVFSAYVSNDEAARGDRRLIDIFGKVVHQSTVIHNEADAPWKLMTRSAHAILTSKRTKRSRPRSKLASGSNCPSRSLLSGIVAFPPPPARTISISTQTDPCSTTNDNYSDNEAEEENAYQVLDWPAEEDNDYDKNNNTSSQATSSSSDLAKIVSSNSTSTVSPRRGKLKTTKCTNQIIQTKADASPPVVALFLLQMDFDCKL
ncbi:hypothetical protein Tsp_02579 [Trichinella spiralis]|uniref:hypothetical protein n=1 Tax=Trichinella spiralis TaxID=6334 RepID=UPI0001EFB7DA|nr:hypothetical protein Tsp_02579 [Trichinella spiralis]